MRFRHQSNSLLAFFFLLLMQFVEANERSSVFQYNFAPYNFFPVSRLRRDAIAVGNEDMGADMSATIPPEYSVEDENSDSTSHTYYNKTVYAANPDLIDKYYVDIVKWLNNSNVNGSISHDHLDNSYRKAAAVKFSFEFPFYGHRLSNLTIATGGFIYVGDQTHSWLAATQYIAPLMANFDTHGQNATIMYGDDGEKMVVEWSRVELRDSKKVGQFTFQVSLFNTGDIWFVYKDIPISPLNISDLQHPCKLGISDAYLFNHKVPANSDKTAQPMTQSKRVIHEYHRISIQPEKITSNVVVVLTALPTCLSFKTCQECSNANLDLFQCSWCNPKGSTDNPTTAFCSDQIGLNRRRQEWVEGSCADEKKQVYCEAQQNETSTTPSAALGSDSTPATSAQTTQQHPDKVIQLGTESKAGAISEQKKADEAGGSGLAFMTLLFIIAVSSVVWVLYAFYNPHTTSGQRIRFFRQLLIKYRPSKWQIPTSHVRYSASVHM